MITFYYPAKNAGGAQNIIRRLGLELHRRGIDFRLWDHSDGWIRRTLNQEIRGAFEWVDLRKYHRAKAFAGADDFILGYQNDLCRYPALLQGCKARVGFWEVLRTFWKSYGRSKFPDSINIPLRQSAKNLIRDLYQSHSLAYMDYGGVRYCTHYIGATLPNPHIIPIPLEVPKEIFGRYDTSEKNTIRLAYIGRPEMWKVVPLVKILNDASESDFRDQIKITIITTEKKSFARLMQRSPQNYRVKVEFKEGLWGKGLDDFLQNNVDLLFAMGTSCLEGGKLGIPTCIVDYGTKGFTKAYRYCWLHKTSGLCLGIEINDPILSLPQGVTMNALLHELQENYADIGRRCYEYVKKYHDIQNVTNKFLDFAESAGYLGCNLNKYIVSQFYDKIIYLKKRFK